jgi:hypothetical protein
MEADIGTLDIDLNIENAAKVPKTSGIKTKVVKAEPEEIIPEDASI